MLATLKEILAILMYMTGIMCFAGLLYCVIVGVYDAIVDRFKG